MGLKRVVAAGLVLLAVGTVMMPAVRAQEASPTGEEDLVLRIGTDEDMVTDNPLFLCCAEFEAFNNTYDKLIEFDPEDLSAGTGGLAEECVPNDDSMVWTCELKEGLMWSDGTPLTAEDVVFTYEFLIDNSIPAYRSYFPFNPTFEAEGDRTFIWKSEKPTFAPIVPPYVYILPKHIWEVHEGKEKSELRSIRNVPAVGSGPFILTEWEKGEFWKLTRNPYWRGPELAVDEILYEVYSNEEAMVSDFKSGQLDALSEVNTTLAGALEGEPDVVVHRVISDWWLNFAFNFGQGSDPSNHPAIQDRVFREAIAHAIDRGVIAERAYPGAGEPGDTVVRPASAFWHLDIPAEDEYAFDPDLSRTMLEEAGYVDSDEDGVREDPKSGEPLVLEVPVSQATSGAVAASSMITEWLADIGVEMIASPVAEPKMNDHWAVGDYDAYIWYWYGDPDPDFQLSVFTSDQCGGWSDGCFSDPTFDEMYEAQRGMLDFDVRQQAVYDAQRYLYEQIPGFVLAYPGTSQAYRTDRLDGWMFSPGEQGYVVYGYGNYQYLTIDLKEGAVAAPPAQGLSAAVWIAVGAGLVLVAGLVILTGRRRRSEEA